ncbi:NAD(P)-binding domain-containing protein [Amphibacillus cookii]|uniref:NAD(P)-binding domain-containing protein n=1 Tax=Amphibacillus cookii TaxID=767787 RepID=UPI00195E8B51|nr:thioredoxin reductase [Amphibacillus cookii]
MNKIYDVIIIGAGPSGIGVATLLKQMNCKSYLILEKEEIGSSFLRWPDEMRFITPSFPAQGFGQTDLNAIVPKTSPAYTLDMEHPTGKAYSEYLELIAEHFMLPVEKGVQVNRIDKESDFFRIETTQGTYQSQYVVWAAGEYQYPDLQPFPGAEFGVHNSLISSWKDIEGNDFMVIGGYESGMDAAYHLARLGKRTTVIAKTNTWEIDNSDPSLALSTYTYGRIRHLLDSNLINIVGQTTVVQIEALSSGYNIYTSNDQVYFTNEKPIIATGFAGSTTQIENLVTRGLNHEVLVNESDETIATSGLFLAGPELRHTDHIFCYIYKFRQRFAVIAETIGNRLKLDLAILEDYKRENFYLKDLSMCGEECQC